MSFSAARRGAVFAFAVLFLFTMILSAFIGIRGGHNHVCSPSDCLICLVASTLQGMRNLIASQSFSELVIFILLCVCVTARRAKPFASFDSPVALKTKILS